MPDSRVSSLTSAPSVAFDAGQLTSDGGLVWLAQADDRLDLSASFSAWMRDWRRGPVRHALRALAAPAPPADRLQLQRPERRRLPAA